MAAPLLVIRHIRPLSKVTFQRYSTVKKTVKDILSQRGQIDKGKLVVEGWVKSFRKQKACVFLHVNDGTCPTHLQVVVQPEVLDRKLTFDSSVQIEGELVASPAKGQSVEMLANSIKLLGDCDPEMYPFDAKTHHGADYLRQYPHLRSRSQFHSALLRVRSEATLAIHRFFQEQGFVFVHTPILTSSDCEGAGETFTVQAGQQNAQNNSTQGQQEGSTESHHFFSQPVYLTVSGQLHLETVTGGFSKAYNFGPTFRAEKSHTSHHLSEFYMIEAEQAFTEDLESIMTTMEQLVQTTANTVLSSAAEDTNYFLKNVAPNDHSGILEKLTEKKFVRMTYTEAVDLLRKDAKIFQFPVKWGSDLQKEHERYLVQHCDNTPVFVTDFPASLKPFYSRSNPDQQTVASVDLLVPVGGELCGGTLREERYDKLHHELQTRGLDQEYSWYLDLRRFGSVPHGGFGMGFERFLQCLLGIANIRDTIPYPRWPDSCKL